MGFLGRSRGGTFTSLNVLAVGLLALLLAKIDAFPRSSQEPHQPTRSQHDHAQQASDRGQREQAERAIKAEEIKADEIRNLGIVLLGLCECVDDYAESQHREDVT